MQIAINTSPLNSLHADRGIGQYTSLLVEGIKKYDQKNTYYYFDGILNSTVDVVHHPFFDIFQPTLKTGESKTVVTIHDLIPLKYPDKFPAGIRGKIAWWRQKSSLKKVDAIITDSEASAKDIRTITGIDLDKIHVVYLPVASAYKNLSASEIKKLRLEKYQLPEKFILYVGDINWNKNIPGLLKAFSTLSRDKKYNDIHLVLVGSSFLKSELPEAQEIQQIIASENLKDRIHMPGFVPLEELVGVYNLASLYIQPSFDEGFGLTPLQALQCATLVISSNRGSLPEVVGSAGDYFDPSSIEDMVKALEKGLTYSVSEKKKKSEKAVEYAAQFSAKKFIEQTISVYEKVVKSL